MSIKGLEKLEGLNSLNRRVFQDESGWHFEIFTIPVGVSSCSREAFNYIPELVVVDLAQENNCKTTDEVRILLDKVMDLFFDRKLPVRSNGLVSVCQEVDTRELKLSISSYQMEMLQQGLWSIGKEYTDNKWDPQVNPEYFALLDMFTLSKYEKKKWSLP